MKRFTDKLGKFFGRKIKAKGTTVIILALISIIGFLATAFDVWLEIGLGLWSAIIAQVLLGMALYVESSPKNLFNPFKGIKPYKNFGKVMIFGISLVVMASALTRLPFLAFTGLAELEFVKTTLFYANVAGAFAIAYEVFITK